MEIGAEYEETLISMIADDPLIIDQLGITAGLFADPMYALMYQAIQAGRAEGQFDKVKAFLWLRKRDDKAAVAFASLNPPLSTANAKFYYSKLKDMRAREAIQRKLAVAMEQIGGDVSATDIADQIMSAMHDIIANGTQEDAAITEQLGDYVNDVALRVKSRRSPDQKTIRFGLPSLDEKLDPIRGGEILVVAGRPGAGKTALAMQLVINSALDGIGLSVFSLEMRVHEVVDRIVAHQGLTSLSALRGGYLTDQQISAVYDYILSLREWPLAIYDGDTNISRIRAKIRRDAHARGIRLAVIDYLGLVDIDTGNGVPRWQQIGEISRQLKLLAQSLGIVIVEVVQMNREAESNEPGLASLRDSGSIEQDADRVILLYEREKGNGGERQVTILLAKNRHGPTGKVLAMFDGQHMRFREY